MLRATPTAHLRIVLILVAMLPLRMAWADRLILRNLDVISDSTVKGFDEDGVQLDDGRLISWDRIEKGRVADDQQAAFDRMLGELGSHLYRIRQRLSINDYRGLLPHAEAISQRYAGRRGETAYMVAQALMWSRLASGHREAALAPYLECLECLRQADKAGQEMPLPGTRRLQVDLATGLTPELPPVWFDPQAAQQQLSAVGNAISSMTTPRPSGARIYYATLAAVAEEPDKAAQALADLVELPDLKALVEAQIALARGDNTSAVEALSRQLPQLSVELQPLALYWLGRGRLQLTEPGAHTTGLLDLLRIAARYGQDHPELAAAGLQAAMLALEQDGDIKGSIAVRRELLDRYGQTWHATRLREKDKRSDKSTGS